LWIVFTGPLPGEAGSKARDKKQPKLSLKNVIIENVKRIK
jgi:hypothetical protein